MKEKIILIMIVLLISIVLLADNSGGQPGVTIPLRDDLTTVYLSYLDKHSVHLYTTHYDKLRWSWRNGYRTLDALCGLAISPNASSIATVCPQEKLLPIYRTPINTSKKSGRTPLYSLLGFDSGGTLEGYAATSKGECGANATILEYRHTRSPDHVYVEKDSSWHRQIANQLTYAYQGPKFYCWRLIESDFKVNLEAQDLI